MYSHMTLLTDYGTEDGFVAACHGVASLLAPDVRITDITHQVPPGDIRRGATVLGQVVRYFPPAIHVVVVDPGVGTSRRAVAVEAGGSVLVGPDNGVLAWPAAELGGPMHAYEIDAPGLYIHPVSTTFHGRDIFTPVAARLSTGLALQELGPELSPDDLVTMPTPACELDASGAEVEVVSVDRFGNAQLSLTDEHLAAFGIRQGDSFALQLSEGPISVPYLQTFASVPDGDLVAYVDSTGSVAVAINRGNAAEHLGLPAGTRVRITPG